MNCTAGKKKRPSSVANRNPPKPYGSPARWSISPSRRNRAEPLPLPRRQERQAAPTELTGDRGTDGSNPSPSSGESTNHRFLAAEPHLFVMSSHPRTPGFFVSYRGRGPKRSPRSQAEPGANASQIKMFD